MKPILTWAMAITAAASLSLASDARSGLGLGPSSSALAGLVASSAAEDQSLEASLAGAAVAPGAVDPSGVDADVSATPAEATIAPQLYARIEAPQLLSEDPAKDDPARLGVVLPDLVVSATPEPGAWALLIAGVAIAGALLRRRRILAAA